MIGSEGQLELDLRRRGWGGRRAGAGRKQAPGKVGGAHRARPAHKARHPVHVVLRTRREVGRLRRAAVYRAIRAALRVAVGKAAFRVVHLSIQHNHLHFLVEAADARALSRGMQSVAIAAARRINQAAGRRGKVFAYRFHATEIASPRQARNALAYVLGNWRRHREDLQCLLARQAAIDPYASARAFDGWTSVLAGCEQLPVSPPRTWLLTDGWQRHGPIDPWTRPGPL